MLTGPDGRFISRFDPEATDRTCRDCGETKPLSEFRKDNRRTAVFASRCLECDRAQARAVYRDDQQRRERAKQKTRHRIKADPEISNPWLSTQRARQHGAHIEDPHLLRLVVLELDDGVCGICGEDVHPFNFQIDHVVPLSKGGEHSYANVQVAHQACNRRKHDAVLDA